MKNLKWYEQDELFNSLYKKRAELKKMFSSKCIVNLDELIARKREEIKDILVTLDVYIEIK